MLTPPSPLPPYPPGPRPAPDQSDARLATSVRTPSATADPHALAVLLGRHWEPVYDFAVLCAPAAGGTAAALAAAAVHQVLSEAEGAGAAALRPRLLAAVRDSAGAWTPGGPTAAPPCPAPAHRAGPGPRGTFGAPGSGSGAADTGGPAVHGLADHGDRRLARRSFEALSPVAQCLLWHTAVEAEPVSVPAALLALDIGTALTELEEARGHFRTGLLLGHRDLAEHPTCRCYHPLLDTWPAYDRLPPDVRHHLLGCPHCTAAVVQLDLCRRHCGLLLAQAVLGRRGADYLATRPGRRPHPTDGTAYGAAGGAHGRARRPAVPGFRSGWGRRPGRHRLPTGDTPSPPTARYPLRALLVGAGLASACALGAALVAVSWPFGADDTLPQPPGETAARTASAPPDTGAPPADVADRYPSVGAGLDGWPADSGSAYGFRGPLPARPTGVVVRPDGG